MYTSWRIFVVSLLLILVGMVAAIWFGGQQLGEYQEKKQAIEKATMKIAALQEIQLEHPQLEVYQMDMAKQRHRWEKFLPDRIQMAELLAYAQNSARNAGMELQELEPMASKAQGKLQVHPLNLRLQGDYFSLVTLLRQFDRGEYFVQIGAMDLEQKPEGLSSRLVLNFFSTH